MLSDGRVQLEVVGLARRHVGDVGQRPHLENVQAGLIQRRGRNPAEHAAVGETRRLIGRPSRSRPRAGFLTYGYGLPLLSVDLREVALPLERGRHAESLTSLPPVRGSNSWV